MNAVQFRRHDLDWLRVFAVYLLFVFHAAMVFNPAPFYHVRNAQLSTVMLILAGFIGLWHMPLVFLLAGWSAYASLSARGAGGFLGERIRKLWVPLVIGCVVLMPPIKYIELRSGLDANYAGLRVSPAWQQSFVQIIPSGLPWCYVLALLGIAHRLLKRATRGLSYLRESAFPVYWLHQAAIVFIGYFIVRLDLDIAAKYALLLVASVSATLAVYHFGVRRFSIARFCVGMQPQRPASPFPAPQRAAAALLLLVVASAVSPRTALGATPIGRWYAEGGAAQVEIDACGNGLCGRVIWLRSPLDEHGCPLRDAFNDDPDQRARAVIGLEILRGLQPATDSDRVWEHGSIYDPASGRTYTCRLTMLDNDRLELRGYLGIPMLGRTTSWFRVGSEHRVCHAASQP